MGNLAVRVNGEARVYTGTGVAGALQVLGVTVDGVEINLSLATEDVIVDTFGPKTPMDVQYFLEEASINLNLIWYDSTVLTSVLGRLGLGGGGTAGTAGQPAAAGSLFMQGGYYTRLLISSIPASQGVTGSEPCWNFPTAFLNDTDSFRVSTRKTVHSQTWRALPLMTGASGGPSSNANPVYNHVCT